MNEYEIKWQQVLELLESAIPSEVVYNSWFSGLKLKSLDNVTGTLNILCNNDFAKTIIESRYMNLFKGCVDEIFGSSCRISLMVDSISDIREEKTVEISTTSTINEDFQMETIINPRYTFENFVVGSNNEYAHAASLAVAENPATAFNPLFLYGESGLGKTHLMHSISNYVLNNHIGKKVLYVTSEMFTNEIISAIRNNKTPQFKDKYRRVDVLLIDDVQFFQGKESIQEEVFNTFNSLFDNNKQIVLSSDRPPSELTGLDERLRQRFGWNIIADVKKPTYETRMAILKKKAEQENLYVDENIDTVFTMIAERVQNNVRELEGAFTNLLSISRMLNKDITPQFAKETLKNIFSEDEKDINVESIKRAVCKYFDINIKDMDSKKRSREIAYPRQIAMYLSKEMTELSFPKIGGAFGGKDHTTVMHAHKKIAEELLTNESTKHAISEIEKKIRL
ncbi:MAG: chromosomal replication initiator protein DnaA [Eubacterium sp.]|nr:chromosomal replication initiator protein DnaA [Eubacterium sp.]